jgi:hypothetical protein
VKRTTTNLNSCDPIIPESVSPLHLKWQTLSQSDFFYMLPGYTRMDTSAPYNRNGAQEILYMAFQSMSCQMAFLYLWERVSKHTAYTAR